MNPLVCLSRADSPVGYSRKRQTFPLSGRCDQCTLLPIRVTHDVGGTYTDFFYPVTLLGQNKLNCQNRYVAEIISGLAESSHYYWMVTMIFLVIMRFQMIATSVAVLAVSAS